MLAAYTQEDFLTMLVEVRLQLSNLRKGLPVHGGVEGKWKLYSEYVAGSIVLRVEARNSKLLEVIGHELEAEGCELIGGTRCLGLRQKAILLA